MKGLIDSLEIKQNQGLQKNRKKTLDSRQKLDNINLSLTFYGVFIICQ